jgi:hypothetical protein
MLLTCLRLMSAHDGLHATYQRVCWLDDSTASCCCPTAAGTAGTKHGSGHSTHASTSDNQGGGRALAWQPWPPAASAWPVLGQLALATMPIRWKGAQRKLRPHPALPCRILSSANRYWFTGPLGPGCGSPHTPTGYVWPLGMMVEVSGSRVLLAPPPAAYLATATATWWACTASHPPAC